jgi:hypothetical protein
MTARLLTSAPSVLPLSVTIEAGLSVSEEETADGDPFVKPAKRRKDAARKIAIKFLTAFTS